MQVARSVNLRRWFLLAFAIVCIGLNGAVYALYTKNEQLNEAKQWVDHTYEVLDKANTLYIRLQDMHIAQRGYLLTGKENFLGPYNTSREVIDNNFRQLLALTEDNPLRQQHVTALQTLFTGQLSLMDRQIALRRATGIYDIADMDTNKRLMDNVRKVDSDMIADEKRLLTLRIARDNARQHTYFRSIFATAGLSVLGLLAANALIGFLSLRRLAAEDDLRRSNAEMEGFTYIASHDLRSPLVNLKGFAGEMKTGLEQVRPILDKALGSVSEAERHQARLVLDEDVPDALRFIHSSVEKMDRLTNAILELSRIGKRTLKIQPIETKLIVERSLNALQHQITQRNITVTVGDLPNVVSDPLSLEQVFGNMLDNAVKYLDPQRPGKIKIGGTRGKKQTTFWVQDNGRGISAGDRAKIFEIYRRAGNNQHIPGEGMGMAYVRSTLQRLGGKIWCESTPDIGTIFFFTINNTLKPERKNA